VRERVMVMGRVRTRENYGRGYVVPIANQRRALCCFTCGRAVSTSYTPWRTRKSVSKRYLPPQCDEHALTTKRLKSALWLSIGKIVDEETIRLGINATPQFIGALTEMVWAQIGVSTSYTAYDSC
jgi:hypothetical protein